MPRPEVNILQSSAEATHENAPKAGMSVTDSRSLSIASTPAETFPEKEVAPAKKSVSPTNLTAASTGGGAAPRIGTTTCWNTLQQLQDSVVEASNAARASRLSNRYSTGEGGDSMLPPKVQETLGVAKVGAATCWTSFSKIAWDMTLPSVDANKHSADVKQSKATSFGPNAHAERLRNLAAKSVTAPELPTEEEEEQETVDEDGLRVEVIETVDSL